MGITQDIPAGCGRTRYYRLQLWTCNPVARCKYGAISATTHYNRLQRATRITLSDPRRRPTSAVIGEGACRQRMDVARSPHLALTFPKAAAAAGGGGKRGDGAAR